MRAERGFAESPQQAARRDTDVGGTTLLAPCGGLHDVNEDAVTGLERRAAPLVFARVDVDHRTRVVHLAGELDTAGRAAVTRVCCEGIESDVRVDLADLTFMDCGGYRGLTDARVALEGRGGSLSMAHAVGEPARLLELIAEMLSPRYSNLEPIASSRRDAARRPGSSLTRTGSRPVARGPARGGDAGGL